MEFIVKIQKKRDDNYPLSMDSIKGKQLEPGYAESLSRFGGLDSEEWYAISSQLFFKEEIDYLLRLGLSPDFIREFDILKLIEDRMYKYPKYFRILRLVKSNVVGDFERCILISRKLGSATFCENINDDFKFEQAMQDMVAPSTMEE